jgi:hypothetical protein
VPVHINTNISVPKLASTFNPGWDVMTFLKITDMTVPMIAATAVRSAAIDVQTTNGKLYYLEYKATSVTKILIVFI